MKIAFYILAFLFVISMFLTVRLHIKDVLDDKTCGDWDINVTYYFTEKSYRISKKNTVIYIIHSKEKKSIITYMENRIKKDVPSTVFDDECIKDYFNDPYLIFKKI